MNKKLKIGHNDMKNSISKMSKDEKIRTLLDYAKECYSRDHKPTKKEIRKKFHLEIYNYFNSIADYHQKAEILVSLRNCPREQAKQYIMSYLKNKAQKGHYPNRKEIEMTLKIHFSTYFKNLSDLYTSAEIDYSLVLNRNEQLIANARLGKYTIEEGRKIISDYIREEVKNGNYPTLKSLYKKFRIAFYRYFPSIIEAYNFAGVVYPFDSNNFLLKEKERILTEISEKLLRRMGYKINRISIKSAYRKNTGSDMLIRDSYDNPVCVEIKAFHKDQGITSREIKQLNNYLKKNNCKNGILITTSNWITKDVDLCIDVIDANKLINLLKGYNLGDYVKSVDWVMNERIGESDEQIKEKIKNRVIDYFRRHNCKNTRKELEKVFSIDLRTYFGDSCMSKLKTLAN